MEQWRQSSFGGTNLKAVPDHSAGKENDMEVYQYLTVNMNAIPQANAFVDAFLNVFCGDMEYCAEDLLPAMGNFRKNGKCLILDEFMLSLADSCLWQYRQIFLRTALTVPGTAFTACAGTSGDIDSKTDFVYANGSLEIRHLYAPDGFENTRLEDCVKTEEKLVLSDYILWEDDGHILVRSLTEPEEEDE